MPWEDASGLYRKYVRRRFNYIAVAKRATRCQNVETLLSTLLVSSETPAVLSNAVRPPNVSTKWLRSVNVVSKWPSRPASSSGCGDFPGKRAMLTVPMPTLTRIPSVRPFDIRARTRAFARIRSWSFLPSFILVLGVFHKNSTWTTDFQFLNPAGIDKEVS